MTDLPYVMGSNARPGLGGGDNSGRFLNPTIRGLGFGSTLGLVNGKRVTSTGADIAPLIAISRVETLLDGASALYGSDAIAGVHNYITRENVEGFELQLSAMTDADTSKLDETNFSFITGKSFERGNITVAYEKFDHNEVTLHDRNLPSAGDSLFGKTYRFREFFAPAAFSVHPDFATAYSGVAGFNQDLNCADDPGAIPNQSGIFCGTDYAGFFPLATESDRELLMLSANWTLGNGIKLYGTYNFSDTENSWQTSDYPWVNSPIVIPPNNPGLLEDARRRGVPEGTPLVSLAFIGRKTIGVSGQRVLNTTLDDDVFGRASANIENHRLHLGAKGVFASDWQWDASLVYSNFNTTDRSTDNVASRVNLALNGLGGPDCERDNLANLANAQLGLQNVGGSGCYFYNPFLNAQYQADGSPQTDPALQNDPGNILAWISQKRLQELDFTLLTLDLLLTGDLGDLVQMNEQPIGIAMGFQGRDLTVQGDNDEITLADDWLFFPQGRPFTDRRNVIAAFVELGLSLTDRLEMQVALRHERYTQENLDSTDPKIAVLWRLTDDLNIRASYSTAYRAPSIPQLDESNSQAFFLNLADPANGGAVTGVPIKVSGNADLDPYSAEIMNIGFSWQPADGKLDGLSVHLDYFSLDYDDLVVAESAQGILNADPFSPKITRDDSGIITGLTTSYLNAGQTTQAGFEFSASYALPSLSWGDITLSLNGVYLTRMDMELFNSDCQCIDEVDGLGRRNHDNPFGAIQDLKANASIAWRKRAHSLVLTWRYQSDYENSGQGTPHVTTVLESERGYSCRDVAGNRITTGIGCKIDSHTTLDLRYAFELPALWDAESAGNLILGAINVTDEDPPAVAMDMGFDVTSHDPRGRLWYVKYRLAL
jgi:iron complex outermembrane receptor protein